VLKKKLKILSEYKTALPLFQAKQVKVLLNYEDGRVLEKNNVDIIDKENGSIEIVISDFELQGLKLGVSDFYCSVYMNNGDHFKVKFAGGQCIKMVDERKVWDDKKH
jgi:hypothetical protein